MAKTIEERAREYATHQANPWDAPVIDQVAREHYAVGANDQHKIDIEKACIWACSQCPLRRKDIYEKWHIGCVLHTDKKECKKLQSLRKEMEE